MSVAKLDHILTSHGQEPSYRQRKRSRFDIYFDVLIALDKDLSEHKRPSLTRVAASVNMSYERLKEVLGYLADIDFCERLDDSFFVTEKGVDFIQEFSKFYESMSRMGVE